MESIQETKSTGGLVNVGFTCYANAAIQALRHTKNIEELMNETSYVKYLKQNNSYVDLTSQFANIVQNLSTITTKSSLRPAGFWQEFRKVAQNTCFEHLIELAPHDSGEFLMFLLDALHESMCREVQMNITNNELTSEKQKFHYKSLEAWRQSFEKHYSPLVNMYFGQFHVQIICDRCKNVSNRWEPFNTLKGVIEQNSHTKYSIIDCILGELNEEVIEEYSCDTCSPTRTKAVRKTKVWKLPETLIVVLKRFTYDGSKIHTAIEQFDTEKVNFLKLFYENSPNKKDNIYSLRSVIDHHGSSRGGHYTAQAKHRTTNSWYLYDDQDVREIQQPDIGSSSYILFFEHTR